jgi:hypothetical protein
MNFTLIILALLLVFNMQTTTRANSSLRSNIDVKSMSLDQPLLIDYMKKLKKKLLLDKNSMCEMDEVLIAFLLKKMAKSKMVNREGMRLLEDLLRIISNNQKLREKNGIEKPVPKYMHWRHGRLINLPLNISNETSVF